MNQNIKDAIKNYLLWFKRYPGDYAGAVVFGNDHLSENNMDELDEFQQCLDAMRRGVHCPQCHETYGMRKIEGDSHYECLLCAENNPDEHAWGLYDVDMGRWLNQWWESQKDAQAWIDAQSEDWTNDGRIAIFKTDSDSDFLQERSIDHPNYGIDYKPGVLADDAADDNNEDDQPWSTGFEGMEQDDDVDPFAHKTDPGEQLTWQERSRLLLEQNWQEVVGRTIVGVRNTKAQENEEFDWEHGGVVLLLDNGDTMMPISDDDGSDPADLAYFRSNIIQPELRDWMTTITSSSMKRETES